MVVEESVKSIPDSNSKPVCRNQFSNNVTRKDCCCTEVGEAYKKECNLCPKPGSSKLHANVFLYLGQSSVFFKPPLSISLVAAQQMLRPMLQAMWHLVFGHV